MAIDDPTTTMKWIGGLITIVSIPFGWLTHRQNKLEAALIKMSDHVGEIKEVADKTSVHVEYIREDMKDLKKVAKQRRETFKAPEG